LKWFRLGLGEATYVDDPRGSSVVLACWIVNPDTGRTQVLIEAAAEPDIAADGAGRTANRAISSSQPAPLLN
jgi:hypothetical protein